MSLLFGSLFSGCGGLDLGLELAGLTCVFQVEIDPYARGVLAARWPNTQRHDDVRTFPLDDARDWMCDLLVGGDPCQENSRARVTVGTRAPSLGTEFLRIIEKIRPPLVLRENPSRTRTDAPWPWYRFRDGLERLGYRVLPFRVRACCVGADHQRDRMFLLAETSDPLGQSLWLPRRQSDARAPGTLEATAREREWLRVDAGAVDSRGGNRADAGDGRGHARIPSRVDRLRMLGNAVDVRVGQYIGEHLLDSVLSLNDYKSG